MGIHSEVVTESVIRVIVVEIRRELEERRNKPEICTALKKVGRFVIDQFELDAPEWVEEFELFFSEEQ